MLREQHSSTKKRREREKLGERRYLCKTCQLSYKYIGDLNRHNRNIHGDLAGPFQCSICKALYKNQGSLTTHTHVAHKDFLN